MQEELLTENTIVKVEEFDPFYNIHRGDVPLKDVLAFCNKNMVADAYEIFEIYVWQNESKTRLFHVDNDKEITLTVDFENKERIINILFQNGDFGYKVKKEQAQE
jgi:hypothetical protein